ncbi:uncharacterized protein ASCRUDRAFT_104934 [Ascoidea rubescens DSM 1968]|uniref:Uncharacterized protein n=1 Tax=Ascoidea rubescens DSM 1968 TaxID=1344418 RepID=A0A1D2VS12_9ASCO|nr:hypothetical protein ASCRUDRAFT_104934 [Ascoidea rubescens DSM 1968]ODV64390.1 hypothetical protein ASCRUDRAFT_104934 [Ascoidea rubescens DSM 1968]
MTLSIKMFSCGLFHSKKPKLPFDLNAATNNNINISVNNDEKSQLISDHKKNRYSTSNIIRKLSVKGNTSQNTPRNSSKSNSKSNSPNNSNSNSRTNSFTSITKNVVRRVSLNYNHHNSDNQLNQSQSQSPSKLQSPNDSNNNNYVQRINRSDLMTGLVINDYPKHSKSLRNSKSLKNSSIKPKRSSIKSPIKSPIKSSIKSPNSLSKFPRAPISNNNINSQRYSLPNNLNNNNNNNNNIVTPNQRSNSYYYYTTNSSNTNSNYSYNYNINNDELDIIHTSYNNPLKREISSVSGKTTKTAKTEQINYDLVFDSDLDFTKYKHVSPI